MGLSVSHHLPCCHADCLGGELAVAHIEEVFQAGAEEVDDEDIVEAFLTKVVDLRYAGCKDVGEEEGQGQGNARQPERIRYERHSSRSCGASALRGS